MISCTRTLLHENPTTQSMGYGPPLHQSFSLSQVTCLNNMRAFPSPSKRSEWYPGEMIPSSYFFILSLQVSPMPKPFAPLRKFLEIFGSLPSLFYNLNGLGEGEFSYCLVVLSFPLLFFFDTLVFERSGSAAVTRPSALLLDHFPLLPPPTFSFFLFPHGEGFDLYLISCFCISVNVLFGDLCFHFFFSPLHIPLCVPPPAVFLIAYLALYCSFFSVFTKTFSAFIGTPIDLNSLSSFLIVPPLFSGQPANARNL